MKNLLKKRYTRIDVERNKIEFLKLLKIQNWRSFFATKNSFENLTEEKLKEKPNLNKLLLHSCKNLQEQISKLLPGGLKHFKKEIDNTKSFDKELKKFKIEKNILDRKSSENLIMKVPQKYNTSSSVHNEYILKDVKSGRKLILEEDCDN